ncbi:MAG: hypothetical protein IPK04_13035 [Bdellovibrionales bacterium]|jgi:hypothetical protein|nr:hypothetical protein [Bdellovibrionales bacterium]
MKNSFYAVGVLALALGMVACSKNDGDSKGSDNGAADQNNLDLPIAIAPGSYVAGFRCNELSKNESLPKALTVVHFKEDGSYWSYRGSM